MQWKYERPPVQAEVDEHLIEEILQAAGLEQLD
ncbi:hypothetical protein J2Z79_001608 [Symbiobacterium terraclitae]|uniref:Uncharacterized protein n=1 Tax=Symbiobacterium terraclitae TaxID=557451 RepID=A0ABS4JRP3_9FIRM|nr:hypothetical protein [Symbiobacterium terraclitae]